MSDTAPEPGDLETVCEFDLGDASGEALALLGNATAAVVAMLHSETGLAYSFAFDVMAPLSDFAFDDAPFTRVGVSGGLTGEVLVCTSGDRAVSDRLDDLAGSIAEQFAACVAEAAGLPPVAATTPERSTEHPAVDDPRLAQWCVVTTPPESAENDTDTGRNVQSVAASAVLVVALLADDASTAALARVIATE